VLGQKFAFRFKGEIFASGLLVEVVNLQNRHAAGYTGIVSLVVHTRN
jgi:hypothetical protein